MEKSLEVYSLLTQRTGVVIVGPPGCGKSTILYVLWLALQRVGARVKRYIMNPKALSRTHLLGRVDPDTREWTDGVLTRSARDVVREPSGRPFLVFDVNKNECGYVESYFLRCRCHSRYSNSVIMFKCLNFPFINMAAFVHTLLTISF